MDSDLSELIMDTSSITECSAENVRCAYHYCPPSFRQFIAGLWPFRARVASSHRRMLPPPPVASRNSWPKSPIPSKSGRNAPNLEIFFQE
jgi:hypothetical protein